MYTARLSPWSILFASCMPGSRMQDACSIAQPSSETAERIDVVADNLGGAHQGHGQDQAHRTPDPGPEEQREGYRQRIQAKPLTHDLGIKDVHGENVQSNHGDQDYPYTFLIDHSHASRQRREQSQEDSEIGNQADKAADNAEKIEIRDAEAPEHNSAEHCAYQANQYVARNETANHCRYSADCTVGNQTVLLREEAYRGSVCMILPGKHEVNQKRYEGDREQDLSQRPATRRYQTLQTWRLT